MLCLLAVLIACSANGSDSKKQRLDEAPPSRVLHIRKLPNEVSETEVIALGLPFGKVTNILMLKGKNQVNDDISYCHVAVCQLTRVTTFPSCTGVSQAFLELGTEEAAITMVNYYSAVTPQVSGSILLHSASSSPPGAKINCFSLLPLHPGQKRHRVHPVLQPQGAEDGLSAKPGEAFEDWRPCC